MYTYINARNKCVMAILFNTGIREMLSFVKLRG